MSEATRRSAIIHGVKIFVFIASVAFIAFIAGGVSAKLKIASVGDMMQRIAMAVVYLKGGESQQYVRDNIWEPTSRTASPDQTVYLHDTEFAGEGFNLVVSSAAQEAVLVAMDGKTVHRWARDYLDIWRDTPVGKENEWIENIYWRRARLLDDGNILVVFETSSRTPYGLGMVKLDKDSNVIWRLAENLHHDVSVDSAGNIYALGQRINEKGYKDYAKLKPPFIDDSVVFVSPDGKKLKEIFIAEAFLKSEFAPVLDTMPANLVGDPIHANTIEYIDEETATKFAFAKAGDLLISLREMNVIAVLDPVAEKIVWSAVGPWRAQHDPAMLKNGNIVLYDNTGIMEATGRSRVLEFNPVTGAVDWSFDGTKEEPLYSPVFGTKQRLANGNTLITDSRSGRVVEVTPDGVVVWDYRTPHRKTVDGQQYVMPIFDTVRVDPAAAAFLK